METIGKMIGVITHTCKVSKDLGGESAQITVKIDFSSATDEFLIGCLVSNRVIAGQRPWRSLSIDEIKALNGQTFVAQSIGQKVKSREEKLSVYTNAGMNEDQANFALDNPEKFKAIMDQVMIPEENEQEEINEDE